MWASQDNIFKSPSKAQEEMDTENKRKSSDTSGRENINFVKSLDKKDNTPQSTKKDNRVIPKVPVRVTSSIVLIGSKSDSRCRFLMSSFIFIVWNAEGCLKHFNAKFFSHVNIYIHYLEC